MASPLASRILRPPTQPLRRLLHRLCTIPQFIEMYEPHKEYVMRAKEIATQKMSAGLLQLIVRWYAAST